MNLRTMTMLTLSTLALAVSCVAVAQSDFLSHPEKLAVDEDFGADLVYYPADATTRLQAYDSVMVDEPVIFLADDSPYKGFKASDLAAVSNMLRDSFAQGFGEQSVSIGNFEVVDEAGSGVLLVQMALVDVYLEKKKRGLFSYTPVGVVAKGVHDMASDAVDKTRLVEVKVEVEVTDPGSGEVIFAGILERGHRDGPGADEASWDAPGAVAEKLGRRIACRLDNARLPDAQRKDCIAEIPITD